MDQIKIGIMTDKEKYLVLVRNVDYIIKYPYVYITP
jgi:hypothetical protein